MNKHLDEVEIFFPQNKEDQILKKVALFYVSCEETNNAPGYIDMYSSFIIVVFIVVIA